MTPVKAMDASTAEVSSPNKLVMAQLSKTKMCIMFTRGACNDAKCSFAHDETELREQPDLAKTAMCRAFSRGECKETNCKYAHGEEELRVSPTVYKTQLCRFHARGSCKKADRCRHAHGRHELRSFQAAAPPAPTAVAATPPGLRLAGSAQKTGSATSFNVPLGDISNFNTPQKRKERKLPRDTPEKSPLPVKVLFPESPQAPAAPGLVKGYSAVPTPTAPGLPIPWDLHASPLLPMSGTEMAAAAAAAAIQAREHSAAASAAQAAAVSLARAAAAFQTEGIPRAAPAAVPAAPEVQHFMAFLQQLSEQTSASAGPVEESRKWVV